MRWIAAPMTVRRARSICEFFHERYGTQAQAVAKRFCPTVERYKLHSESLMWLHLEEAARARGWHDRIRPAVERKRRAHPPTSNVGSILDSEKLAAGAPDLVSGPVASPAVNLVG